MAYKGILLDLDNTLYDYDRAHTFAFNQTLAHASAQLGLDPEFLHQTYLQARHEIHLELAETAASHNRLLYFQRTLERIDHHAVTAALSLDQYYWNHFLEQMVPYDHVYDFLHNVQEQKICIVTDLTAHIQFRKIDKLGLTPYVDYIVTSEEAGKEKPHPYIFLLALRKLGLGPESVCMIGDNYAKDIVGADRLGMDSYWYNPKGIQEPLPPRVTSFASYLSLMTVFANPSATVLVDR